MLPLFPQRRLPWLLPNKASNRGNNLGRDSPASNRGRGSPANNPAKVNPASVLMATKVILMAKAVRTAHAMARLAPVVSSVYPSANVKRYCNRAKEKRQRNTTCS